MKYLKLFEKYSTDEPDEIQLARAGILTEDIRVFEWWTELKAEEPERITVFFIVRYAWPESSDDDMIVETSFSSERSRGYIEERMMLFANKQDVDWIHDMERNTWKKVNR